MSDPIYMDYMSDRDFLTMCIEVREQIGLGDSYSVNGKYFSHGGFINFYSGSSLYVVRDCDFTRKYLEAKGYTAAEYGVAQKGGFLEYSTSTMDDVLKREGPYSEKYRKLLTYLTEPLLSKVWGKLDEYSKSSSNISSLREMTEACVKKFSAYFTDENAFLRTRDGKYAVLLYAFLLGFDYFKEVEDMLAKKGLYHSKDEIDDVVRFIEALDHVPVEYFQNIRAEIANNQQKSSR